MHPTDEPFRIREIWPTGTLIKGDYEIERKIGSGGFGTVYLAKHRFLGTTHVIKRLHEQFASDEAYVRKFVNEARIVRRLRNCPHVVEVEHMTQSEDGHLILVMEHIDGGDLGGLMESRRLSVAEVVEYARQIATGLDAAHAAGLVHRDIKPQNIMLSHNTAGRLVLKLIDFGIAADHMSHTQTSVLRGGSIGYAAPEQWVKSGRDLDGRADLYALGATMYRMLCGRMPYEASEIGGWIEHVKSGPPVVPSMLRPDVPKDLSDLILHLLAVRPENRPADAAEVIRRLEVPMPALTPRAILFGADELPKTGSPAAQATQSKPRAWHPVVIATAAAVVLGATTMVLSNVSWFSGSGKKASSAAAVAPAPPAASPMDTRKPEPTADVKPPAKKAGQAPRPVEPIRAPPDGQGPIHKVVPVYPALARQARIQGSVRFNAIIGKDGTVRKLQLVSGHPLLVEAAAEALRQWVYKPALLNGQPVEVSTQIEVNFKFNK